MVQSLTPSEALSPPQPPLSAEQAQALVQDYGSPLYVYQGERLRQTLAHITASVPYDNTAFHFAAVTNGNVALLQQVRAAGWGLHANTPGDIYLGRQAGFAPGHIVYSGSNLTAAEMVQALDWGVQTFNLDSLQQLQRLAQVSGQSQGPLRLGLRLNLPAVTGDSRIGVRPEEFAAAQDIARQAGLTVAGLHFYRGTGTNATQSFLQALGPVLAVAQQLPDWRYLDFGGGFGYPYRPGGAAFDWPAFGAAITERLRALGRPVQLIIEPGRAVIANCATLLSRVISVKWQGQRQIVGVDTTVANLSVPSVHGGYRAITSWQPGETLFDSDVCGNTTYSRDYLGRHCPLPPLQPGDLLAILDVGAYGYAMSSHFLHRPRPAEILLEGQHPRVIRKREDYSVLLANQVLEGA